ncbi:transcription cofactor HES-6-like [Polypterus senegalus]|uniref:transcription cofactor HES-6-like n=1 Tax=Polypterus senegalus TaxID=55291 RepID=UPI001966190C|nr:transcription cofactor HES-6-like [Polypterus senegalus]
MAPVSKPNKTGTSREEDEYFGIKGDRKARKPLVEKKRRARINESLQELRGLLSDAEFHTKMENAEVLEMTVKRVENILRNRALETDTINREASERFAAGYIQCMHEVHMFVSNCPGIDATVAAELLNHLLESMPLSENHFQDMLVDLMSEPNNNNSSTWPTSGPSSVPSPAPSTTSSEDLCSDLCSDLDETDTEQSHISADTLGTPGAQNVPNAAAYAKSMWRPW